MAEVTLESVIDITVFNDLPSVNTTKLQRLITSGMVFESELLNTMADAPTKSPELPFWNDLDHDDDVNYSNDRPQDLAVPSAVEQGEQIAQKAFVNKGWRVMDLANELTMGDLAMTHIKNRTDSYFLSQLGKRFISSAVGVLNDSVANHDSDMVIDISSGDGNVSDSNRFSRKAFVAGAFTAGDHFDNYVAVGVHSMTYQQMVDADDVEDVKDSEGNLLFQTYMGRRIIVDDDTPILSGPGDSLRYVTVLYGNNAIGYGRGTPTMPTEISRVAEAGNGGGMETLWRRNTWLTHPFGYQSKATTTAQVPSPTLTQLRDEATWTRVVPRKVIPLAFVITN